MLRSKRNDGEDENIDPDAALENSIANSSANEANSRSSGLAGYGPEVLSGLNFFMKESAVAEDLKTIHHVSSFFKIILKLLTLIADMLKRTGACAWKIICRKNRSKMNL